MIPCVLWVALAAGEPQELQPRTMGLGFGLSSLLGGDDGSTFLPKMIIAYWPARDVSLDLNGFFAPGMSAVLSGGATLYAGTGLHRALVTADAGWLFDYSIHAERWEFEAVVIAVAAGYVHTIPTGHDLRLSLGGHHTLYRCDGEPCGKETRILIQAALLFVIW